MLTYDARGHGCSDGESTLGDHEQHDVAAAVALARTRTDRVVLVGASMGAVAALRYAVTDRGAHGPRHASRARRSGNAAERAWRPRRGDDADAARSPPHLEALRRASGAPLDQPRAAARDGARTRASRSRSSMERHDHFIDVRDAAQLHGPRPIPSSLLVAADMGHAFGPLADPRDRRRDHVADRRAGSLSGRTLRGRPRSIGDPLPRETDQPGPGVHHHHDTEGRDEGGRGCELLLALASRRFSAASGDCACSATTSHAARRPRRRAGNAPPCARSPRRGPRGPHHMRRAVPEFEQRREPERAAGPARDVGTRPLRTR